MSGITDLLKKLKREVNDFGRDVRNIPEVQQLARNISQSPQRIKDPKIYAQTAENYSYGLGKRAIDFSQNSLNTLSKVGNIGRNQPAPQVNFQPIKNKIFSDKYRVTPKEPFVEGAGGVGFDFALMQGGAGTINKAKTFKPIQKVAGKQAGKLYATGKNIGGGKGILFKGAGKGLAEVSQSLPYTGMSLINNTLENRGTGTGFITDVALDTIMGQFFGKNFSNPTNQAQKQAIEAVQTAIKNRDEQLLDQAIKLAKQQGIEVNEELIPQLKTIINQTGSIGGLNANSFKGLQGEELGKQFMDKGAFSDVKDRGVRFYISDRNANINRNVFNRLTKQLDETGQHQPTKLGEFFRHKELYKEYPNAQNITLRLDPNVDVRGSFNPETSEMILNPKSGNWREKVGILLHENQHYLQEVEDFARGGNPLTQGLTYSNPDIQKLERIKGELGRKYFETNDPTVRSAILQRIKYVDKNIGKIKDTNAVGEYRKVAGEIESRAVQNPQNILKTTEQLKGTDIVAEQMKLDNIAPRDVIVKKGGGVSANLDPQELRKKAKEIFRRNEIDDYIDYVPNPKLTEYTGSHEAPMGSDYDALYNVARNIYPDDIYSQDAVRYYGHGEDIRMDFETVRKIQWARGKPDNPIKIYRAVPKDVPNKIEVGDWVTINRNYAKQHGESTLRGDYKIITKDVYVRDLRTDGNSIHEWGYDPQPTVMTRIFDKLNRSNIMADVGEDILQEAKKEIGSVTEDNKPVRQKLGEFYTDWVNRFYPIEKLEGDIEKNLNIKIRPEYSPTFATKRLMGAGGVAELRQKQKLEPILKAVDDAGIEKSDFDVFLKAKRDIELAGREQDIVGVDAEKAGQRLQALEQKYGADILNGLADRLYAYQDETLRMYKDSGFIDETTYNNIKEQNKNYVSFERVMDEVDNYLGLPTNKLQQATNPLNKIKGSERQIYSPTESAIVNTYKAQSAVSKNEVAKSIVRLNRLSDGVAKKVSKSGNNTISVWENGKKSYYEVSQDISEVVKGLNEQNIGLLEKIASIPVRMLRQQATGRNLDFMVPNVFRDQFDAAVNSKYGYRPIIDYIDGLKHLINFKRTGQDNLVEQWINSGGKMSFDNMSGRKAVQEQITDATKQKRLTKRLYEWVVGGIDTLGEYSEAPTRIGLFKRGLEATGNTDLAMMESREATLDFARMGAKMKTANSVIPFLNVSVQGFDRMIRTAKDNPTKFALALSTYALLPQTLISVYNNLYHGEEYANIPDFEKEGNFLFITGKNSDGTPNYIKIPKGHIVQLASGPVDNFITYLYGNNPQTFSQLALLMFSSAVPVVGDGNTVSEVGSRTLGNLTLQAIKPVVENTANYSFFKGRSIVPPTMAEHTPKAEQYFDSTPGIYKTAGAVLNQSPLKLQNLAEGYLAGGVKQPLNLLETVDSLANNQEVNPNKVPIARRFYGNYSGFDIDRPEKDSDQAGLLERVSDTLDTTSALEELPEDTESLEVIYKSDLKTVSEYRKKRIEIENDTQKDEKKKSVDIKELEDKTVPAYQRLKRIEGERSDQIFEIQLNTYSKSSGDIKVPERGQWAVQELNKIQDENQLKETINKMWDSGVLTTGKRGTAQWILDNMGINLFDYTGEDEDLYKRVSSSNKVKVKKPKKVNIKSVGKINAPKIKFSTTGAPKVNTNITQVKAPNLADRPKLNTTQLSSNVDLNKLLNTSFKPKKITFKQPKARIKL